MTRESSRTTLSLLDHCISCKAKCCKDNHFTATEEEHDYITAAGHPDYFYKVTLPHGTYYLLEYRGREKVCPYLQDNDQCSIEAVKPDTCKAFPVRPTNLGGIDIAKWCPAKDVIMQKYIQDAKEIIQQRKDKITAKIYWEIVDACNARFRSGQLEEMGATVTEPPDLKM